MAITARGSEARSEQRTEAVAASSRCRYQYQGSWGRPMSTCWCCCLGAPWCAAAASQYGADSESARPPPRWDSAASGSSSSGFRGVSRPLSLTDRFPSRSHSGVWGSRVDVRSPVPAAAGVTSPSLPARRCWCRGRRRTVRCSGSRAVVAIERLELCELPLWPLWLGCSLPPSTAAARRRLSPPPSACQGSWPLPRPPALLIVPAASRRRCSAGETLPELSSYWLLVVLRDPNLRQAFRNSQHSARSPKRNQPAAYQRVSTTGRGGGGCSIASRKDAIQCRCILLGSTV